MLSGDFRVMHEAGKVETHSTRIARMHTDLIIGWMQILDFKLSTSHFLLYWRFGCNLHCAR